MVLHLFVLSEIFNAFSLKLFAGLLHPGNSGHSGVMGICMFFYQAKLFINYILAGCYVALLSLVTIKKHNIPTSTFYSKVCELRSLQYTVNYWNPRVCLEIKNKIGINSVHEKEKGKVQLVYNRKPCTQYLTMFFDWNFWNED